MVKEFDLPEGLAWPFYYGFIQETLAEDGDPLDVVILTGNYDRGASVKVKVIDAIDYVDRGENDPKLITLPLGMDRPGDEEIHESIQKFLVFLEAFKQSKGHDYELQGLMGELAAKQLLTSSRERWERQ